MDIFEAMETCRAIRRLKPDPVPDDLLQKLVHYATRAPSAGNSQLWSFLVVTDPEDRKFIGKVLTDVMGPRFANMPEDDGSQQARVGRTFRDLVLGFERVPAVIFPCVANGYPATTPDPIFMWSTIYPATQNLLLAARALGLGAAMTTFHHINEPAIKEHFGIPEDIFIGATIPVGYPIGKYGPLGRRPDAEVTFWNRWNATR
ncbi:nitroreductase [bacterium SCGC AG-212-C10]|nr:nitroreductase [bacterium SCGC AG-212-C10]